MFLIWGVNNINEMQPFLYQYTNINVTDERRVHKSLHTRASWRNGIVRMCRAKVRLRIPVRLLPLPSSPVFSTTSLIRL